MTATSHPAVSPRTGLVALCLAALVAAPGCAPKIPPPPPEYANEGRVPTGDNRLEFLIEQTADLLAVPAEEQAELQDLVLKGLADDAKKNRLINSYLVQGKLKPALDVLHTVAYTHAADYPLVADALGTAMGHLQWDLCAKLAEQYLNQHVNRGTFLVRGLCLERSGDVGGARDNYDAAMEVAPFDKALFKQFVTLSEQRASGSLLPPADDALTNELIAQVNNLGILERLFVAHLLNRHDQPLRVGTIDQGELSPAGVRTVIQSRARSYRHCHKVADLEGPRKPDLSGRTDVAITIGPAGQVQEYRVESSSWNKHPGAGDMDKCFEQQVERLVFPRPEFSRPIQVTHRFSFAD